MTPGSQNKLRPPGSLVLDPPRSALIWARAVQKGVLRNTRRSEKEDERLAPHTVLAGRARVLGHQKTRAIHEDRARVNAFLVMVVPVYLYSLAKLPVQFAEMALHVLETGIRLPD